MAEYGTNIVIRGMEKVEAFLKELPRGTAKAALQAIADYLIGDDRHGLKHYAPYKYFSRPKAYGNVSDDGAPPGYFSMKQFRYVMAKIKSGEITPGTENRTGETSEGWAANFTSGGYRVRLYNLTRGAKYINDDYYQARQPAGVGHRKVSAIIASNMTGAMRSARAAVDAWIKAKR